MEKGYFIKYPDEDLIRFMAENFYHIPFSERKKIKVLDFGSGCGRNSIYLAKEDFNVYGLETTDSGIKVSKKQAKKEEADISFIQSDLTGANFPDNFFNAVVDIQSIQHNKLKEIEDVASEIHRILKDQGLLFSKMVSIKDYSYGTGREIEENTFTDIPQGSFSNLGISHFFSLDEIEKLFKRFRNVSVERYERTLEDRSKKVQYWLVTARK